MRNLKFTGLGLITMLAALTACDGIHEPGALVGTIVPQLSYDTSVVSAQNSSSSAETENSNGLNDVTIGDLTLTLVSEDAEINETFQAESFPTDKAFPIGQYTMTATYGDMDSEGFDCPALKGVEQFEVTEANTTAVALVATPSKAMVRVLFDESLTQYMTSMHATLNTSAGAAIDYPVSETRSVYVQPGATNLTLTFVKPNGLGATMNVADFEAQARHSYEVTVKMGGNGSGEVSEIIVSFDESVEQQDVMVDIADAVLSLPAPEVTPEGFTNGQAFILVEDAEVLSCARFNINARSGIAKAVLSTNGVLLTSQGWPAEIDLIKASPTEQAMMNRLGYKDMGLFRNPGKMAAVDLSGVVKHIPASNVENSPVAFSLVVTDVKGRVTEPVSFSVQMQKLQIELSVPAGYTYTGGKYVRSVLTYNGTKPLREVLTMQYENARGIFVDATLVSANPPAEPDSKDHIVLIEAPTDAKTPMKLRAKCGNLTSNTVEVPMGSIPEVSVADNEVYATSFWATVSNANGTNYVAEISDNGGKTFTEISYSKQDTAIKISGLQPNTTYQLRVKVGSLISNAVTVKTEETLQLPNSDMESWTTQDVSAVSYHWTNYIPASPWATINEESLANKSTNGLCTANETTLYTFDAHGGTYAAEVRTGASSPYSVSGHSSFTYYRGELYVGYYQGGAKYGTSFASRPSEMSFWYKYMPYNGCADQGYAYIEMQDANGNIIASGEKRLDATNDYTKVSIKLTYSRSSAKANKIIVIFRSSATTDFLNEKGLPKPDWSLNKKLTGSIMYIDDIELSY